MTEPLIAAAAVLDRLRAVRPMVHHITNEVVMNDTANITLHIGAAPVMAMALEEAAEMVRHAGALVLNIGTLLPERVAAMLAAGREANARGIPVVLDPVGVGATAYRTDTAARLLGELAFAVIRGNAGEIAVLAGAGGEVRGVDSVSGGDDPAAAAAALAARTGAVVAMTGPVDVVTDGARVWRVANGHPLMGAITGTGCMSTALVASCAAVEPDPVVAASAALAGFGIAGEVAAVEARGPGSFKVALFDAVAALRGADVAQRGRVSVGGDGGAG